MLWPLFNNKGSEGSRLSISNVEERVHDKPIEHKVKGSSGKKTKKIAVYHELLLSVAKLWKLNSKKNMTSVFSKRKGMQIQANILTSLYQPTKEQILLMPQITLSSKLINKRVSRKMKEESILSLYIAVCLFDGFYPSPPLIKPL